MKRRFSWEFLIFILVFIIYSLSNIGGLNSGDQENYALTKALVEKQTVFIDDFKQFTFDRDYAVTPSGHLATNRAPGLSLLATPFYLIGKLLENYSFLPYLGLNRGINQESILQTWTYTSAIFFVASSLSLLFLLLKKLSTPNWLSIITVFSLAFATLNWKYSVSFYRHPLIGMSLCLANLLILFFYSYKTKRNFFLALAAVFLGISLIGDYLSLIPISLISILLVTLERKVSTLKFYFLALIPFLVIAMFYNSVTFGKPLVDPHQYSGYFRFETKIEDNFKTPLLWGVYLNLFSFGRIPPQAINWALNNKEVYNKYKTYEATIVPFKGIFVQTPILFFAVWGWFVFFQSQKKRGLKKTYILFPLLTFLSLFIIFSTYTLFWAPTMYDTRHLLVLVPILLLGLIFLKDSLNNRYIRLLFILALVISVYFAFESQISNFSPNYTGRYRYDISQLIEHISQGKISFALLNIFPNIFNLPMLLLVGSFLYLALVRPLINFLNRKI
ncbi:hypothetical protein HYS93_00480 [Candidatus Daviesbacteria bacterium]|nr:hypothetical protein [Candidatus Daviesbacteria bacterium]